MGVPNSNPQESRVPANFSGPGAAEALRRRQEFERQEQQQRMADFRRQDLERGRQQLFTNSSTLNPQDQQMNHPQDQQMNSLTVSQEVLEWRRALQIEEPQENTQSNSTPRAPDSDSSNPYRRRIPFSAQIRGAPHPDEQLQQQNNGSSPDGTSTGTRTGTTSSDDGASGSTNQFAAV